MSNELVEAEPVLLESDDVPTAMCRDRKIKYLRVSFKILHQRIYSQNKFVPSLRYLFVWLSILLND